MINFTYRSLLFDLVNEFLILCFKLFFRKVFTAVNFILEVFLCFLVGFGRFLCNLLLWLFGWFFWLFLLRRLNFVFWLLIFWLLLFLHLLFGIIIFICLLLTFLIFTCLRLSLRLTTLIRCLLCASFLVTFCIFSISRFLDFRNLLRLLFFLLLLFFLFFLLFYWYVLAVIFLRRLLRSIWCCRLCVISESSKITMNNHVRYICCHSLRIKYVFLTLKTLLRRQHYY